MRGQVKRRRGQGKESCSQGERNRNSLKSVAQPVGQRKGKKKVTEDADYAHGIWGQKPQRGPWPKNRQEIKKLVTKGVATYNLKAEGLGKKKEISTMRQSTTRID